MGLHRARSLGARPTTPADLSALHSELTWNADSAEENCHYSTWSSSSATDCLQRRLRRCTQQDIPFQTDWNCTTGRISFDLDCSCRWDSVQNLGKYPTFSRVNQGNVDQPLPCPSAIVGAELDLGRTSAAHCAPGSAKSSFHFKTQLTSTKNGLCR